MVEGHSHSALVDSGCSVTLVKADGITSPNVPYGNGIRLLTVGERYIQTQGWVRLTSVRSGNTEIGPLQAYVVFSLPLGVDLFICLPPMLRLGCWIGEVSGTPTICWYKPPDVETMAVVQSKDVAAVV